MNSLSIFLNTLTVEFDDGCFVSVPTSWFRRLANATLQEQGQWRFIGGGHGIHWEALDEDSSIEALIYR